KGGGKHGKHEPVTDSTIVTAVSYVSGQVFEHLHAALFRSIPTETAMLQTKQFCHLPSINLLCLLSKAPKITPTGLELLPEDSDRFKKLVGGLLRFNEAMVLFRKRGKKGVAEEEEENGD
ncbi:hypothetical protein C8J57DRAFT_1073662, partial [Mycena rebaudengoi]